MSQQNSHLRMPRRQFLKTSAGTLGSVALGTLLENEAVAKSATRRPMIAKAKRVIFLFQHGGPSQIDLFDEKPFLHTVHGKDMPKKIFHGQRFTGMTAGQGVYPVASSPYRFERHGQSGLPVSSLMPFTAKNVDDLCFLKAMTTDQIEHDAAATFLQTGHQFAGRPSAGAWVSYGLGSECDDLPAFVVLVSNGKDDSIPVYDRMWGNAFLPSKYQGVRFGAAGEPVLYLNNPTGMTKKVRRQTIDQLKKLNRLTHEQTGDPEILARQAQYEMAFRMQSSVPDLTDLSKEPNSTYQLYGDEAKKPGTYASHCLLARRMAERGVRFIQLIHRGWDAHFDIPTDMKRQCQQTDQASAALVYDLKQRGLLDDTLIIWGGEFGRTAFSQGTLTPQKFGRDHHGRCFTMWLAGGGVKPGFSYGKSDQWGFNVAENPVSIYDLYATMWHLLGRDHTKMTFEYQGRDFRLTDVHGRVVKEILA